MTSDLCSPFYLCMKILFDFKSVLIKFSEVFYLSFTGTLHTISVHMIFLEINALSYSISFLLGITGKWNQICTSWSGMFMTPKRDSLVFSLLDLIIILCLMIETGIPIILTASPCVHTPYKIWMHGKACPFRAINSSPSLGTDEVVTSLISSSR